MLRLLLFLGTNIGILLVLSISLRLLGVDSMLEQQSGALNLNALLIFSAVFGMGARLSHWPCRNGWRKNRWVFNL